MRIEANSTKKNKKLKNSMRKSKINIGLEILESLREIKRGELGRVRTLSLNPKPLGTAELKAMEIKRNLAGELLKSVKQMKAGKTLKVPMPKPKQAKR